MRIPDAELAAWTPKALRTLYWDGIVKLPWVWPKDEIDEYVSYMKSRPLYTSHVKAKSDGIARSWDEARDIEVLSYDMADTLAAPHFFEFALQFTEFAHQLLGRAPKMYSCNAFWTKPGMTALNPDIQEWHRDRDDYEFLALFMYATDVTSDRHGPHLYAKGTHRGKDTGNHPPRGEPIERVFGTAGTLFFTDPAGLHMGIKPKVNDRLLAWARWGISEPTFSYRWDKLSPVPATQIFGLRYDNLPDEIVESTRLIVNWSA